MYKKCSVELQNERSNGMFSDTGKGDVEYVLCELNVRHTKSDLENATKRALVLPNAEKKAKAMVNCL
jgi:hypothetical protein